VVQKSVLIADDDQFIQDLLGFIVEDQGHRHLQCKTGWDVITLIEHEKIDLLILDVLLPQMSGIEVVKKLKQKNLMQRVPILLITGVYSPDQLKKSLGDDWTRLKTLYKPLSLSDFQKTLSQYLIPHNEVNYVFPHCVSHKPGFQKRIMLSDSRNFNNETDQSVKWFIPKNGSFSECVVGNGHLILKRKIGMEVSLSTILRLLILFLITPMI